MSEDHSMEPVPSAEKVKKCKRKSPEAIEDAQNAIRVKLIKRIMLSLTKPSYVLGLDAENVRSEARDRLGYLLTKLIRQQNWVEASGVLSVLLKGTNKDKSPATNRLKYSVAMELLRQVESDGINPNRIKNIFDIWMKKIGSMKDQPVEGNIEEACQAALSLMQYNDFGNDPISNLVTGLTFSQIWYSAIPKEVQWKDPDLSYTYEQLNMSESRFSNEGGNIERHNFSFYTHEAGSSFQSESDSSVMIGKDVPLEVDTTPHGEDPMAVDARLPREGPPKTFHAQVYYMGSAENTESEAQPFSTYGLSQCDSIFSAHDQVDDIINEVENFCATSKAAFPFRLRASLLDCCDCNNHVKLSSSFEDALEKDPTCSYLLGRLISMHQNGNYVAESLLEMIALHLDATLADHSI